MSRIYDNWEKLVGAVLRREENRRIALCESFSSSISVSSRQNLQPIEFKEIIKATKSFQRDVYIGKGVFCQVFKAWIDEDTLTASEPGSGMAVAVRRWNPMGLERHQDWVKEIDHLIELRHPNLVELVGYCSEEDNMILVYEFMGNESLGDHLFIRDQSLPWAMRIKVAIDAARGLSYLHNKETPIIHRDFKTANILLDGEFNAKLSNYWYGRDDPTGDTTHVSTDQVVFTYGYIAPEYAQTGHITTKFNVYSFGVVLLELLSGRRVCDTMLPTAEQNLLEWAKGYLGSKRKKLLRIMDTRLEGQYPHNGAYKVAKIALQCLSLDPKLRPTMDEVVVALQQL